MSAMSPLSLALTAKQHVQLRQHLYPGDGKEAVAILLCGQSNNDRRYSLLTRYVYPVPYAACRIRDSQRVTWSPDSVVSALTRAMQERLVVVKAHSHPGGYDRFSPIDDTSDLEFFNSVFGWLDTDTPQASVIMLPDGRMFGRSVYPGRLGEPLSEIRVAGDDFHIWRHKEKNQEAAPRHAKRIIQAFGEGTYVKMRSLRVGVVGCSGTGSVVCEQLARNCVGEMVIVDPEVVEPENLNRVVNSTQEDVKNATPKVQVVKRSIEAMGMGTSVLDFQKDLLNREVIKRLSSCDVIFGCMDSIDGRHILNKLASYYLIPYIDMGVRIDADGQGEVSHVSGVVHTVQPGGSSLMSRGLYSGEDLQAAMMRRWDPKSYAERHKEGYIKGIRVDQPAVISLNMQIAATALNELLARIHLYRVEENRNFAIRRIVLSDPLASSDEADGEPCNVFNQFVGLGDQEPPLGYPELSAAMDES